MYLKVRISIPSTRGAIGRPGRVEGLYRMMQSLP
jgi:hypothetical protein